MKAFAGSLCLHDVEFVSILFVQMGDTCLHVACALGLLGTVQDLCSRANYRDLLFVTNKVHTHTPRTHTVMFQDTDSYHGACIHCIVTVFTRGWAAGSGNVSELCASKQEIRCARVSLQRGRRGPVGCFPGNPERIYTYIRTYVYLLFDNAK